MFRNGARYSFWRTVERLARTEARAGVRARVCLGGDARRMLALAFVAHMAVLMPFGVRAQGVPSPAWSQVSTIPGYGSETNPPLLIADQDNTVHAFASQWVGDEDPLVAITYNRWTPEDGWTEPVDVLLSPIKEQARVLDVYLDQKGIFHLLFFGGDETEAYLFYAKAPAALAGTAAGWSLPEGIAGAIVPASAAIVGDGAGGLSVVTTGHEEGYDVYALHSADDGENWSDPVPIAFTYSEKLIPYGVAVERDSRGRLHALWQQVNISGQGRGIFYSRYDALTETWTDPVDLSADVDVVTDLGTMTPALIIHDGALVVFYNVNGKIVMQRSADGGGTWMPPVTIFGNHLGVNGWLAPVVDSRNRLHLFFGQRITGTPDIHGMWHSVMRGANWLPPDPIISGPQVMDMQGSKAFDPYDARAAVVQGNVLLVTWRTDPGLKGNGVWYAFQQTDAPALVRVPLPTVSPTATLRPLATMTPLRALTDALSLPLAGAGPPLTGEMTALDDRPILPLAAALVPVSILLVAVGIVVLGRNRPRG